MMKKLINLNIIAGITLLSAQSAMADSLNEQLLQCRTVDNDIARLQCFDDATQHMNKATKEIKAAVIKQSAPVAAATPPAVVAPKTQTEIFGFESQQIRNATPDKLLVTVVEVTKSLRGKSTFTLANGQVWKQKDSESYRLKSDKQVFIKKGALGSFFLGQEGRNKKIRVKRTK